MGAEEVRLLAISVSQCWVNMDMERKSQAITPSLERERQGGERGR